MYIHAHTHTHFFFISLLNAVHSGVRVVFVLLLVLLLLVPFLLLLSRRCDPGSANDRARTRSPLLPPLCVMGL